MKMDPIVFRESYKEDSGFKPFKKDDDYIFERSVLVVPFRWQKGFGIQFKIVEKYAIKGLLQSHERKICDVSRFDHEFQERWELRQMMMNLATGDLRGDAANSTAHSLFWKLFAFSNEMKTYLPDVVDFFQRFKAEAKRQKREKKLVKK